MASVWLEYNLKPVERLEESLDKLSAPDYRNLLDALGQEAESQVRRRLAEEKTDPEGTEWESWSQRYARTRHSGHSLLEGEGNLIDSIQYAVVEDTVLVGSPLVYAAVHQFGGEEVGIPIPPRPYLGFSPENEQDLEAVMVDWLEGEMEQLHVGP